MAMKIDAVAVASSDLKKTLSFYTLLGFEFEELGEGLQHIEPLSSFGGARLMIDSKEIIADIMGEEPKPGNHSSFAIQFDSSKEVNTICSLLTENKFNVVKEPWDAPWRQRYAVVADPDGYLIDLYSPL
jgi:catechol 2,3-dioxygenase-like lactoylglutathione lyase family enzyme